MIVHSALSRMAQAGVELFEAVVRIGALTVIVDRVKRVNTLGGDPVEDGDAAGSDAPGCVLLPPTSFVGVADRTVQ